MRSAVAFCGLLASLIIATPATASECPGHPGALGTSRTIVVDPSEHNLLGSLQYAESLPLNDKEVVITFDDGPLPPYSTRILDILARECVKATFFMVGRMARSFPRLVRRTYNEGHTLANHSQSHPFNFHKMSVADAAREIEGGFDSIAAAVGDPAKVAPFFRFPGLLRQEAVERYLASKRIMSWSVDFMADDWRRISAREILKRALSRLEAKGKGILLLHDIQPATALGLPDLLSELKARGYRIVHVVPASAGRPRTITTADQWRVRRPPSRVAHGEPKVWPRAFPHRARTMAAVLATPSVMSFGAETPNDPVPVVLVAQSETLRGGERGVAMPVAWPEDVITIAALPAVNLLPVPAAANFRYARMTRSHAKMRKRRPHRTTTARPKREHAPRHHEIITRSIDSDTTGSIPDKRPPKAATSGKHGKSGKARSTDRPALKGQIGHQIHISRPQASAAAARH